MRQTMVELLRCPKCQSALQLENDIRADDDEIESGSLSCTGCETAFPVAKGIPRFVPSRNYADNFGFQWNVYRKTQLDSFSGQPISSRRFERFTGWSADQLCGKLVLDAGCGAGRFAEIAVATGAHVVALDFSSAIDAAHENLAGKGDIDYVQADAAALPFAPGTFDHVYCLGVIQHTLDPSVTFASLAAVIKPGGKLALDVYPSSLRNVFFAKYWIRPITKWLKAERAHRIAKAVFPILYPISRALACIPVVGHYLRYLVPVANYQGVYPLTPAQLREWALLDTFDMWAPAYDAPQSKSTICRWFYKAGFADFEVFRDGFLVGRGTRPRN